MTDDDVKQPEPTAWYDSKSGWVDFTSWRPVRKPSGPDAKWLPLYDESTVRRLIAEAVEREREACAALCQVRSSTIPPRPAQMK